MTFKKITLILLIFGLVFAGEPFPNEIGDGLILEEYTGDLNNGEAYYYTEDYVTIMSVYTEEMSLADWQSLEQDYYLASAEYDWQMTTDSGIEYYYYCESFDGDYGYETYCFVDYYENGVFFMTDVDILESSNSQTLQVGIDVSKDLLGMIDDPWILQGL